MRHRGRRIAFVDARYHSFYGAQKSLFTLVTNLTSTSLQPLVLLPGEGVLAEQYRQAGIDVHILSLDKRANKFGGEIPRMSLLGKASVLGALLKYNFRVARWLRNNGIDIVYANDLRALLYVGLASRLNRIPLIWYVRVDGRPSLLSHLGLRIADRIILIADGVRSVFSQRDLTRFRRKIRTLHTGFELRDITPEGNNVQRIRATHGIPASATVIGIVASITQRKGHDLLISALASFREKRDNVHLMIIGDTPVGHEGFRVELDRLIERFGLGERVHWVGYQKDVTEYYQAMDLLALPSRSEGLPRTIIEALGAGLPVVATDVGGVREILISDKLGRVVPPDDVESLSQALLRVIDTPGVKSDSHRIYRREFVEERFSIEAYVRGFQSIVDDLS